LRCPGNLHTNEKGEIAMKKVAVILVLAFATGMTLTTAFAFGLMPLGSIY
jgi:hypothetical protein